jgi:hypothetical protein
MKGRGVRALRLGSHLPLWHASYTEEQKWLIEQGRFIPLAPFAWRLRHGDLKQTLMQRVPAGVAVKGED